MSASFLKNGLPKVSTAELTGRLMVIEGADGSGRSTQIGIITRWMENLGYAVVNAGIKRSTLVSEELAKAQDGNILSRTTMSLFYATDFADQLENKIIPALKAGAIVLCDRYIYTLMARDMVRGHDVDWINNLYGFSLVPDLIFYLHVEPDVLIERNLEKNMKLDYWESGMDLGLSKHVFDSFLAYQKLICKEFVKLQKIYDFNVIEGREKESIVTRNIQEKIKPILPTIEAN
jgi:dTMP kinase